MASLSDSAAVLFGHLPLTYGADRDDVDPFVARWLEALAFELERIASMLDALRSTTVPGVADDTVGSLARWEATMGLPVSPPASSPTQRRAWLLAALRGRRVAAGSDWTASMSTTIGGAWTAHEHTPGPNQLTIDIPFAAGTPQAGQTADHARRTTPANQQLIFNYAGRFAVGISAVGDEV